MSETMQQIQRLANERLSLWHQTGGMNAREARRVQDITDRLALLWDQHRREVAGGVQDRSRAFFRDQDDAA